MKVKAAADVFVGMLFVNILKVFSWKSYETPLRYEALIPESPLTPNSFLI